MVRRVGDFLLPAYCRHCGERVLGGEWAPLLCMECGEGIAFHDAAVTVPPALERGWALGLFEGGLRRLLIDLKYSGVLRAGRVIGAFMEAAPGAEVVLRGAPLVVPVPLHWWRRWRRGHNQARVLAAAICRQRGLEVCDALVRRRATRPQVGLERQRRLVNLRDAFEVKPRCREQIVGRRVVLIDDVITTGATVAAAAEVLRAGGAAEVWAYAAAWAPDPSRRGVAALSRPRRRNATRTRKRRGAAAAG